MRSLAAAARRHYRESLIPVGIQEDAVLAAAPYRLEDDMVHRRLDVRMSLAVVALVVVVHAAVVALSDPPMPKSWAFWPIYGFMWLLVFGKLAHSLLVLRRLREVRKFVVVMGIHES